MKHKKLTATLLSMCMSIPMAGNFGTTLAYETADVNCDGKVTIADLVNLQKHLLGSSSCKGNADLNGDGSVDVFDICILRDILKDTVSASPAVTYDSENITANIKSNGSYETELDEEFTLSQTEFALEIFRRELQEDKNTLLSPYSVMQALAMTANGADGDVKTEMENVLGGMPIEKLNTYLNTLRISQPSEGDSKLSTANSIWMREGLNVYPAFLQTAVDYYNADCFTAPFNNTTKDDINNWVSLKTDEMIPEIVNGIPNDALMYLINAVAFDAKWEIPFDFSRSGDFTAVDGTIQEADMMSSFESYYLEDENARGIFKYYKDRKYAFAALLPDEGVSLNDYVSGLTAESLNDMMSEPQRKTVAVNMPKFKYDYDTKLNATLSAMGMPTAFEENVSAFPKISDIQLRISDVIHKTHIEVDEAGTKAAAVTSVELVTDSIMLPDEFIDFDRPFLYFIIDTETNIPVFLGTLTDISE